MMLIVSAYLAFRIYYAHRLSRWWLTIALSFVFMIFNRILVFSDDFGPFSNVDDSLIKFLISVSVLEIWVFLILGLYSMHKSFRKENVNKLLARRRKTRPSEKLLFSGLRNSPRNAGICC